MKIKKNERNKSPKHILIQLTGMNIENNTKKTTNFSNSKWTITICTQNQIKCMIISRKPLSMRKRQFFGAQFDFGKGNRKQLKQRDFVIAVHCWCIFLFYRLIRFSPTLTTDEWQINDPFKQYFKESSS